MLRILVFVVLGVIGILILFVIGCLVYGTIRAKTLRYRITMVEGKVVRKEYNGDEVFKFKDKIHRVSMDDEFLVFILVNGKEVEFDDIDLFNRVECDESVKLEWHRGYDKSGHVRHEYFEPV